MTQPADTTIAPTTPDDGGDLLMPDFMVDEGQAPAAPDTAPATPAPCRRLP